MCGACGSLSVVDVRFDDEHDRWVPEIRRPTTDEREAFHRDEQVKSFLDAYHRETVRRMGSAKVKGTPAPLHRLETGAVVTGVTMRRRTDPPPR